MLNWRSLPLACSWLLAGEGKGISTFPPFVAYATTQTYLDMASWCMSGRSEEGEEEERARGGESKRAGRTPMRDAASERKEDGRQTSAGEL
jgi:hypothetical protein